MNIVDLLILLLVVSAVFRGYQIGFIRQALSTAGFVVGLYGGSKLASLLLNPTQDITTQTLITIVCLLVPSFGLMAIGENVAHRFKHEKISPRLHMLDGSFGSIVSIFTLAIGIWLASSLLALAPPSTVQNAVRTSRIVGILNDSLPPASRVLGTLNALIDPNSFPQVFTGNEPSPDASFSRPSQQEFATAAQLAQASVVKIEGFGCGGIVDGSGFVVSSKRIVTNAHVVAGVKSPKIIDKNGTHNARVVWFDRANDIAILAADGVTMPALALATAELSRGDGVLIAGYPQGGDYSSQTGVVLDRFVALGRDIYSQGKTRRDVYSLQATIVQGNSGGPVLNRAGQVVGIVFATSTTYNNVGYALTVQQVADELARSGNLTNTVSSGQCSE